MDAGGPRLATLLISAVLALSPIPAHAVAGPDSVAVIANKHIDQSKALAAHYAAARQIPARQVCELNVPIPPYDPTPVPAGQYFVQKRTFLSVPEFRTYVAGGLEQCLGERALERIEAVVIVRGVPLNVGISVGFGFHFPSLASVLAAWKSRTVNGEDLLDLRPMLVEPICDPASINCLARWRNPLKDAPEVFGPGWSGESISEEGLRFESQPLMVTMLHGLSYGVDANGDPEVDPLGPATNLIDSALAAEAAGGATGKFLFMRSSDVFRGIRDTEYEGIVARLAQRGFTDAGIVDFSKTHTGETLASFFVGTADLGNYDPMGGSSTIEGNSYAPGALVDNITSAGAVANSFDPACTCPPAGLCTCYFDPIQPSISRWVAMGVGGVHGTVGEPFANAFPARQLILDYVDGATLAEAYFRNMPFIIWRNLVLGDPMLAPYATRPVVTIQGVSDGQAISGTVQATVSATDPASRGIESIKVFLDGVEIGSSSGSPVVVCVGADADGTQLLGVARAAGTGPPGPGNFHPKGWAEVHLDAGAGSPAAPCPPSVFRATPGDTTATVEWDQPASGGSAITGFTVTSNPGGLTAMAGPNDASAVVTGLQNGTAYTFTVTAASSAGTSPPSLPSGPVTPAQLPGAPSIVSAAAGFEYATVSWTPGSDGGSPVTGYTVISSPATVTLELPAGATSARLEGLATGTPYTFTVTARNAVGAGPPSAASGAVTPAAPPDAPVVGTAALTGGGVTVSWTAPASDGGRPITGYRVEAVRTISTAAGDGTATVMAGTYGVAVDPGGEIYITDTWNNRVRKLDGGALTVVAGGSTGGVGDGGPATSARLSGPSALALRGSDMLYIADEEQHRVRKVDLVSGFITTVAGNGAPGFSGDGSSATAARLHSPTDIVLDSSGNLFIADRGNHRVRRVDAQSGDITTVAGTGVAGFNGDGPDATLAELWDPAGLALGEDGSLFISDSMNGRVRKVSPIGAITTVAGGGDNPLGDGGPATSARLVVPYGLALDDDGNLYVAEGYESQVRQVSPGGTITTLAGDGSHAYGGDGGPASAAQLRYPRDLVFDGAGQLLIADAINNSIRAVSPGDHFALAGAAALSAEVTGLAADTTYTFVVRALNEIGTSAPSAVSNGVLTPSVPDMPTNVTVQINGPDSVLVTWTPPASDGGSAITGYIVTSDPGGVSVTVGPGETSAVVSGLTPGTTYTFTVVATNAFGESAPSDPSSSINLPSAVPALGGGVITFVVLALAALFMMITGRFRRG